MPPAIVPCVRCCLWSWCITTRDNSVKTKCFSTATQDYRMHHVGFVLCRYICIWAYMRRDIPPPPLPTCAETFLARGPPACCRRSLAPETLTYSYTTADRQFGQKPTHRACSLGGGEGIARMRGSVFVATLCLMLTAATTDGLSSKKKRKKVGAPHSALSFSPAHC